MVKLPIENELSHREIIIVEKTGIAIIFFILFLFSPLVSMTQAQVRMAPDGSYVGGKPQMAPDGSYVGGKPQMAPDGSYVGSESSSPKPFGSLGDDNSFGTFGRRK